jgi:1,4-dihydroxy-2-naphthoate octaprenyltransferase
VKKLGKLYQLVNVLSLDVVAGAIVSALFFARIFAVQILSWGVGALGLTVWIIYTADHLVDARSVHTPASSKRHRFHQNHFALLAGALLFAGVIDGVMISLIRKPVLYYGLVLAVAVIVYLSCQRRLKYVKEFCGALLYSVGVVLPAWSLSTTAISLSQGLFIAEFCITVLCNLLLFSLFDLHHDLRDHHHSFVTVMGERTTRFLLSGFFMLNGALMLLQFSWLANTRDILLVILFMNLMLLIIFIFHKRFEADDRYRIVGDAVFLVPLFSFLL